MYFMYVTENNFHKNFVKTFYLLVLLYKAASVVRASLLLKKVQVQKNWEEDIEFICNFCSQVLTQLAQLSHTPTDWDFS